MYAELPDRQIISITGSDRIAFLQGLVSNDVSKLQPGEAMYAALLSPQGKFLHDFLLAEDGERILLDVNAARAEDLLKRFSIYRLRANVSFEALKGWHVYAAWAEDITPQNAITARDPRHEKLGLRYYSSSPLTLGATGDYEHHRITLCIPDGARDMHIEKSFLLEFDFERLNGVSFSKGCYVGQEVTARSKFRGQVRKKLCVVKSESALPPPGTPITVDEKTIGELRSVSDTIGLALLSTDWLEANEGTPQANGIALSVS